MNSSRQYLDKKDDLVIGANLDKTRYIKIGNTDMEADLIHVNGSKTMKPKKSNPKRLQPTTSHQASRRDISRTKEREQQIYKGGKEYPDNTMMHSGRQSRITAGQKMK